jgi:hypothetical protein
MHQRMGPSRLHDVVATLANWITQHVLFVLCVTNSDVLIVSFTVGFIFTAMILFVSFVMNPQINIFLKVNTIC